MSRRCQESICGAPAIACYLPDLDRGEARQATAYAYLCPDHAFKRGHCKGCGEFWGGVESFEFLNGGYCDDCRREIDRAFAEERDWDDREGDPVDDYEGEYPW